jgi:DNA primase
MRPELASAADLEWLIGDSANELLLQKTIAICLQNPQAKPVVIMRALEGQIDITLQRELEQALNVLDETLDLAKELAGARQQLQQLYAQKNDQALLAKISEKPLSSLTENERNQLKSFASKPKSK